MIGDEARVVAAFTGYLEADGWTIQPVAGYTDVVAHRDGITLYAEAKGRTTDAGLDVDTMYGQLLRRIPDQPNGTETFAVVVPSSATRAALRVPSRVRNMLGVTVYVVGDDGLVTAISQP